ncbi:MAG: tol-pal system protein YbgF [Rhodoferax sp.]|nr:tol-pal system protein YbgF [Rhodoferax sp.]
MSTRASLRDRMRVQTFAPVPMRLLALALGSLWLVAAPAAHAGLFDDEEARRAILDLRQRIDASRQASDTATQRVVEEVRKQAEENAQLRRSILELQGQIDSVRGDLAKQRGLDEQLARDVAELQRSQKNLTQGVDDRLKKIEPTKVSVDGQEFTADPLETRDYEAALAVFRKGDFPGAQTGFFEFVKRYPQSGYGPSALFWLGNAQYATRAYKEAVANFRAMLAAAPTHPKAPEAALSIANCQMELKDAKAARKTLDDLIKVYPQSEAAVAAKDRLSKIKI